MVASIPMTSTANTLMSAIERLNQDMAPWLSRFPDEIGPLLDLKKEFADKLARFASEGAHLRIGIMGQVKAGKSSFLNALLFDGAPVLPEAATPKTANLTRISYGERPTLTVSFYSLPEWREIEQQAASTGQHAEARVGRDLLAMVQQNRLDVTDILAQGELHLEADDIQGLMGLLNDYVGENGRYTALVKMTQLLLPREELKGFDVVDTPGMNDPVPSRTQKTKEFMAQCDVVFFLSRCSQFLDQSDIDLLSRQLPGKGVKRLVLVAGQLDATLLDDGYDRSSLLETLQNIRTRNGRRAEKALEELASFRDKVGDSDVAAMLRQLKQPIFASTYAHGFASWPEANWSAQMQHVYKELLEMAASSWLNANITPAEWRDIGNFAALSRAYQQARADKQVLIEAQKSGMVPEIQRELRSRLQGLIDVVKSRANRLQHGEVRKLDAEQKACEQRISAIAQALQQVITHYRTEATENHRRMAEELRSAMGQYSSLATRTGTETSTHSYEVSTSRWYNPFSWGSSRTVSYTQTSTYQYLATADAIEQITRYGQESATNLQRAFNQVVSTSKLRAELRQALLAQLDTGSLEFDPAHFKQTLESTLGRLKLPSLTFSLGDVGQSIASSFSTEVRDSDDMRRLEQSMKQSLESVFRQLDDVFAKGVSTLCRELDSLSSTLLDLMSDDLRRELDLLRQAFADKENELCLYQKIVNAAECYIPTAS